MPARPLAVLLLAALIAGLAPPAHAQAEPGNGERVDVTQVVVPPQVVADRVFHLQVTVQNRDAQQAGILLFTTLYLGSGSPCEGQRADHAVSTFQKSVTLAPHATMTVDGEAAHWGHMVNGSRLPGDGSYEVCVWARLGQCPQGQPLAACFLDHEPAQLAVRLRNTAPEVRVQASALRGMVGDAFTFVAEADDADGDPFTLAWDFGDATPAATTRRATHRFGAAGTYNVTATADDTWDRGQASVSVVVAQPGTAPPPGDARSPDAGFVGLAAVAGLALALRRRRR